MISPLPTAKDIKPTIYIGRSLLPTPEDIVGCPLPSSDYQEGSTLPSSYNDEEPPLPPSD